MSETPKPIEQMSTDDMRVEAKMLELLQVLRDGKHPTIGVIFLTGDKDERGEPIAQLSYANANLYLAVAMKRMGVKLFESLP